MARRNFEKEVYRLVEEYTGEPPRKIEWSDKVDQVRDCDIVKVWVVRRKNSRFGLVNAVVKCGRSKERVYLGKAYF